MIYQYPAGDVAAGVKMSAYENRISERVSESHSGDIFMSMSTLRTMKRTRREQHRRTFDSDRPDNNRRRNCAAIGGGWSSKLQAPTRSSARHELLCIQGVPKRMPKYQSLQLLRRLITISFYHFRCLFFAVTVSAFDKIHRVVSETNF